MSRKYLILFIFFGSNFLFAQDQFSVFFESNKFTLNVNQNELLQKWIVENKTSKILTLNGYTDEDGSNQYNDTLSIKRVENIYKQVFGKIKIREDFKKISFGEQHSHSKIKAENRKVTIFYLKEKDLAKEAEILGEKVKSQPQKRTFPSTIEVPNFGGGKEEIKLDVAFMQSFSQAQVGEKIKISNLNFAVNTFAITKESRSKLYELLLVMQSNPNLKISIQGHLCCIVADQPGLSTKRAKAIKQFLEHNGIESTRMTFKGFGGSMPLYAIPEKSEEERAANRRVEIEVLER